MNAPHVEQEHRVTPLELFFDLVFVFAFTQVTTLLSDDPTWGGLGRGLLILAALWWAWAVAMKETLAHVGDELGTIPALGLCGGSALYLFAYVALRLCLSRTLGRGRFVAAVVLVLLLPVALAMPALVALALIAAVWVALHAYEFIWWREARAQTRALRVRLPLPKAAGVRSSPWPTTRISRIASANCSPPNPA
jgi:low temperature requirement protein LtrA